MQDDGEREGVLLAVTGVEHHNLVFVGQIIVLVHGEELVDPEVWEDGTDSVKEDVRTFVLVFNLDVVHYALVKIFKELLAVGIAHQCIPYIGRVCRIGVLLLRKIFQHRGMAKEFLLVEEVAKLLEQVDGQGVNIGGRPFQVLLEVHDVSAHEIFLRCRILIDEEVIEEVADLRLLKPVAVQQLVQSAYCLIVELIHDICFLMASI